MDKKKKVRKNKKSIIQEFREFLAQGNVLDLVIGLTVGAAFKDVVNSLVSNLIMPPVGFLLNNVPFENLYISLDGKEYETIADAEEASAPILKYGQLISDLVDFLVIAIVIFLIVRLANSLREKQSSKNSTK